jgi:hypothetical protein
MEYTLTTSVTPALPSPHVPCPRLNHNVPLPHERLPPPNSLLPTCSLYVPARLSQHNLSLLTFHSLAQHHLRRRRFPRQHPAMRPRPLCLV